MKAPQHRDFLPGVFFQQNRLWFALSAYLKVKRRKRRLIIYDGVRHHKDEPKMNERLSIGTRRIRQTAFNDEGV